ncbi:DUF6049 family protein [Bifidobacterium santillanense]|nr:DUF6049 family protein [Bifidobacterium santillanense]
MIAPTAHADDAAATGAAETTTSSTITLTSATAVVTSTSGYHLTAMITNTGKTAWSAGTVSLYVNPMYTFVSRTDMQEWSQNENRIPTPSSLGSASVPEIAPGATATVSIDVKADDGALGRIANWGPKPLLLSYAHDDDSAQLRTFLTRSSDGLGNATPAMKITVAMPLTSSHWTANSEGLEGLVTGDTTTNTSANANTGDGDTSSSSVAAAALDQDHARFDRTLAQTMTKHAGLQTIADPTYLDALAMPPQVTAVMQPAGFDITTYAAKGDAQAYANAGVGTDQWNAQSALGHYRDAIGDQQASTRTVAWQGNAKWTLKALTEARRQGYDTVIATHDFDSSSSGTVHTGTAVVPTEAGDVTVLVEQRELSNLVKGKATSRRAKAEATEAGRLARFVAQSAFYQMEQPYTDRNLLVCFDQSAAAATVDAFMTAIEQSSWLQLTDLDTLAKATPHVTGEDAAAEVPDEAKLTDAKATDLDNTLSALTASHGDIIRFRDAILDATSNGSSAWIDTLLAAHNELALHALSSDGGSAGVQDASRTVSAGTRQLADDLLGGVHLTPSEAVTMVSETASMPVTISNTTAYPVTIRVSSITDSPEIVTSRTNTVTIAPRSESQVTFTLRAATSGSTAAHVTLLDRTDQAFGLAQDTPITCVLKISDKTGFVIIGLAVLLGILGLWRQFNRKKDPDE